MLFLLLLFLLLIYQDFQYRAISWWSIPLLFITNYWLATDSFYFDCKMILTNLILMGLQYLGVSIYFSIKEKKVVNITNHYLGIGDVLFFIAITPLFAPLHYCFFLIGSLLLTLLITGGLYLINKPLQTIPLAGFLSLYLVILIPATYITEYSLYFDQTIVQMIYG